MSVVTTPDVVSNITESCEIDRVEAWELYEAWVDEEESEPVLVG